MWTNPMVPYNVKVKDGATLREIAHAAVHGERLVAISDDVAAAMRDEVHGKKSSE